MSGTLPLDGKPIVLSDMSRSAAGINEHWCEHPGCKAWGGRGYARGRSQMVWFCYEHCADADARPEAAGDSLPT